MLIITIILSVLGVSAFSADELSELTPLDLSDKNINVYSSAEVKPIAEEKILCDATIDDDFEDDSVIVVLKNAISRKLENHTAKAYDEIDVKSVTELTSRTKNKIKNQRTRAERSKAGLELSSEATSDELYVGEYKFHQIVKLDLGIKSKENVLECIKKLEARDDVLMAIPNYRFKPTSVAVPNDYYYPGDDGNVTTKDVTLLQKYLANIIDEFGE